ncbi:MAG: hypothetical protein JJE05_06235 [Actinobacteria bacterium]|nr:hypothetical protein [Actinomycetota bacterium]
MAHPAGSDDGWVTLASARGDIDANLMAGRLNVAGVETDIVREFGNSAWLYGGSNPWSPVTIRVPRPQLEDARSVLAEISFDAPAVEPETNLHPGSPRRGLPLAWLAVAVVLGVLLIALSFVGMASGQTDRRCEIPIICGRN